MSFSWIKMWLEALDDPKLTRLSLAERGAWWSLLMLAGKCRADGKIVSGGVGLDMNEIADALHIKTNDERQAFESMLAKMEERGSLAWNDDVLIVVHYEERQRIPPSARPNAVADRVRRYRDRKKGHALSSGDPMLAERLTRIGIEHKELRKKLGHELTTEERLELEGQIDRELEEKYGRKIEDARSG